MDNTHVKWYYPSTILIYQQITLGNVISEYQNYYLNPLLEVCAGQSHS